MIEIQVRRRGKRAFPLFFHYARRQAFGHRVTRCRLFASPGRVLSVRGQGPDLRAGYNAGLDGFDPVEPVVGAGVAR